MSMLELVPWRRDKKRLAHDVADDWLSPLHHQIDRMFEDFLSSELPRFEPAGRRGVFMPDMDISDTDERIEVTAELPGLDEKDIEVTLDDDVLTIKGEKKSESTEEDKERNHYRLERSYGAFRRSFRLPPEADNDRASADFDKGVLRIVIAKDKNARTTSKRISVDKAD